jgi:predicted DNA-binding transcriptional regulator AlpA
MNTSADKRSRLDVDAERLLLRIGSVMRVTGLGRSTIYRLMADLIWSPKNGRHEVC